MSVAAERKAPIKGKTEQIIVNFDAQKVKAPFLLRCGALLIDYIILVSIPTVSLLIGRLLGNDGGKLLNSPINNVSWLIMVLLGLTNFVIIPMFSGQTLGKFFTGIRIVKIDGTMPGFINLILRNVVGYLVTVLTAMLGFMFAAINPKGRALHDLIGGTVVIYGEKKPMAIVEEKSK